MGVHRWWALLGASAVAGCIENDLGVPLDPGSKSETTSIPPSSPTTPDPDTTPPPGDPPILPCDDLQVLTVDLAYPERQDCPFGIDDNLDRLNEFNRARVEEVQDLVLPDGAQLCDLAVHSQTEDLLFDDHVTLTLDEVVLVGGGYGYDIAALPLVDGLYRYTWAELVDVPFADQSAPYYCLGAPDSTCVMPQTEIVGPVDIELSDAATDTLIAAMVGRTTLPFRLITFGDDNDGDCAHTELTLTVDVSYTVP